MTAKRFSEAMWFKHGDGDELAESEGEGLAPRYEDDGSLSAEERARYNLRTGRTEPVAALRDAPAAPAGAPAARVRPLTFAIAATGLALAIGVMARILS